MLTPKQMEEEVDVHFEKEEGRSWAEERWVSKRRTKAADLFDRSPDGEED